MDIIPAMIELDVEARKKPVEADAETPFRILILGDFGCVTKRPMAVDRDNIDQLIKQLGVSVRLPVMGQITFEELEDFHPDQLLLRLNSLAQLDELRAKGYEVEVLTSDKDWLRKELHL